MTDIRIAIIGTGFSGLGMAIRLKQKGIHDFVVLERAEDVGGTWRDNTYPGCQCDVPSHLYSFSFAPNPDWSRTYSEQPEIWEYLRRCSERYGASDHIRFGHEVTEAAWNEDEQHWALETNKGTFTASVVIGGLGPLTEPAVPELPGLDSFRGTTFHSARWDHGHDLDGKRVAVIGTGASAIQFVPRIQPLVGKLEVFQRTPAWVLPHTDRPITRVERRLYRASSPLQRLNRAVVYFSREWLVLAFTVQKRLMKLPQWLARRHMHRQVPDPELRSKLTPNYMIGCKRILLSNDWYPALTKPNVELVTSPIREVRPSSLVTEDGVEHEVDTIIFGTGFHVTDMPAAERLRGRDGVLLSDVWQGSPQAHLGTAISGFPNLFMLIGPNTGLGHNSMVFMIESQIAYVLDCLGVMEERGLASVEVRPEVQERFNAALQREMRDTVWTAGGCSSWYLDANGRNTTLWPGFTWRFRQITRRFDPAQYVLRTRTPELVPARA